MIVKDLVVIYKRTPGGLVDQKRNTALVWTVNPIKSKLRSSQDASAVSGALPLAQFTDIHSPEHSSAGRDHTKRLQHSQGRRVLVCTDRGLSQCI